MTCSYMWSNALKRVFSLLYFFHLNDSFSSVSECLVNVFDNIPLKTLRQPYVWGWRKGGRVEFPNVRRKRRPWQPPALLTQIWILSYSSGCGNRWFILCSLQKKREGGNAFFDVTVSRNSHSPAHATCVCTVHRQCKNVRLMKILFWEW